VSGWLIVGLGNPGGEYANTRHNAGFMLVDLLAEQGHARIRRSECSSLVGRCDIENEGVELAKPQTFMNLSGEAVNCLVSKPPRSRETLVIVSDDLALPLGTIRIRRNGSHGGQNGLRSIMDQLKTQEFIRLRIGIGPEYEIRDASRYVLSEFSAAERKELPAVLERAADAIGVIITNGVDEAMGKFS